MRTLSSVGIGLSLVFGCLLLALFLELYYLLYWRKRITNRDIEEDDDCRSSGKDFIYMSCWKKQSSLSSAAALNPQEICSSVTMAETHVHEPHALVHPHSNRDLWSKPFGEDQDGVEAELVSLQNLPGPPRFLFPIKEETKEDLESEDGKSRGGGKIREGSRGRTLNDLLLTVETPFLSPLASPSYFTPPLTPVDSSYNHHHHHGFSPLLRSSTDAEFNRVRTSPPPKFKFLKDAEEKLLRRRELMEEAEKEANKVDGYVQGGGANKAPSASLFPKDQEKGSFIKLIVAENKEREPNHPYLASSTSTFGPPTNQKPISH